MAKIIMIIDDSPLSREMNRVNLVKAGYQVILAEDGLQAIAKLKADNNVDLIIMDLVFSGLDGISVLSVIRDELGLNNMPVIIFTNSEDEADKQAAFKLGVIEYMVKHKVSTDSLVKYIKQLIH
ncbi:MAG: response regulator [Candidatus Omnitrophota bacterium]